MTEEARAANVIEALGRVMRDLPGIGKDQQASAQQGGYAYRGIEAITAEAQGLFARHGVVFTPHVLSYEVRDLVINNKPWTDVYEMVEYTVYGPGGVSDCIKVGPILSIGRDNSDKGGNKCLTQAYKYALTQTLTISDGKDDGDGATHEADARSETLPVDTEFEALVHRAQALPLDLQRALVGYVDQHAFDGVSVGFAGWYRDLPESWKAKLDELLTKAEQKVAAEESSPEPLANVVTVATHLPVTESQLEQAAEIRAELTRAERGAPLEPADPTVLGHLVDRLNNLPSEMSVAAWQIFTATFGTPEAVTEADMDEVRALVDEWEKRSGPSAGARRALEQAGKK